VLAPTVHCVQLLGMDRVLFDWMKVNVESEFYYIHEIKNFSNGYY